MRSIAGSFLFVVLIALGWAVQTPLSANWNVHSFAQNRSDKAEAEEALIRLGQGALRSLRGGLAGGNLNTRFHCAKILMVLGQNDGEGYLLKALREHPAPADPIGREAETFLIAAWDRRDGPNEAYRKKLREIEGTKGRAPDVLQVFNECLLHFPYWADGYARRARLYQQAGEVFEAKRDALTALVCAPNHFDALVTLGRIQLSVEAPNHAYKCFERAILVNPRLKEALKNEMLDALRLMEIEKEKHREEKRKGTTLA